MTTIFLIAAVTVLFVVGMTIFTDNQTYKNAIRYNSLSVNVNNNNGGDIIGDGYTINVNFSGAIVKKTKVSISSGESMGMAIDLAGGMTSEADVRCVNLNYSILANASFYIPKITSAEKISLNNADSEYLVKLPNIGAVTAMKIIDYRNSNGQFYYLEEIMKISGIGTATFDNIKDLIIL